MTAQGIGVVSGVTVQVHVGDLAAGIRFYSALLGRDHRGHAGSVQGTVVMVAGSEARPFAFTTRVLSCQSASSLAGASTTTGMGRFAARRS